MMCFLAGSGKYLLGNVSSNRCPEHSARITSQAVCKAAASAKGYAFKGRTTEEGYPAGCYRYHRAGDSSESLTTNYVYFNAHTVGGGRDHVEPLCIRLGTVPFAMFVRRARLGLYFTAGHRAVGTAVKL